MNDRRPCLSDEELLPLATGDPASVEVQEHLGTCADCRQRLDQLKHEVAALRGVARDLPTTSWTPNAPTKNNTPPDPSPNKSDKIGKYTIVRGMAAEGQATVYLAVDPILGKNVVIKLSRNTIQNQTSLEGEGRLIAKLAELNHPNLLHLYDMGNHDGHVFLAMEHVKGQNLQQRAEAGRPNPRQAAALLAKVARAAAAAHRLGITHRDIKPANILIDESGEPRLIDFGIASLRSAWEEDPAEGGSIGGTPEFMAPEQARGVTNSVNQRSDIFALGAVLYYLLTGKPPFGATTRLDSFNQASRCEFDRSALRGPGIPNGLTCICLKAMAKNQSDRYATADELAKDLERFVGRPKRRAYLLAIAVCAMVVLAVVLSWPRREPIENPATPPMRVHVWRDDKLRDLSSSVPLRSGDHLQFRWQVPDGYHATMFWFDTEGKVDRFDPVREESTLELCWPRPGGSRPLVGPAGTELVFLCASRSQKPTVKDVDGPLVGSGKWPQLPGDTVLWLDQTQVGFLPRGRGPGDESQERDRVMPISDRAEQLRRHLAGRFEYVSGIAFPHQE